MLSRTTGVLVTAALLLPSAIAPAQSPPSEVCLSGCYTEYRTQLERCGPGASSGPCIQTAALAYRTCLSVCPGPDWHGSIHAVGENDLGRSTSES